MTGDALLLGGGLIAVTAARSLARAGVSVEALGTSGDPVRHSRCCSAFHDLGAGGGVQERWLEWLRARPSRDAVILPCNDDALELVARHRAELVDLGYRSVEADDRVVLAMLDKHETYRLARDAGVPVPATALVGPGGDIAAAGRVIGFPLALKPRHSHLFAREFGLTQKVFIAADEGELLQRSQHLVDLGLEMLVTEVIPGPDDAYHSYYSYVDEDGRSIFELTKHKLRQYPIGFGLATYHVIDRDPHVMAAGRRFFQSIGLRGLGCVEFKRDARDETLKLIECNHRLTAGTEIVRHAGVDLTLLVYGRATGRPDPSSFEYRAGVYMWHPVEDARAFLSARRSGALSVRSWISSLCHRQHFPLFSWTDPGPTMASIGRYPGRALLRLRRRDRGSRSSNPASLPEKKPS